MLVQRDGQRVRLITRSGYNWTKRFPWIVQAALKTQRKQLVIDGDGVDGYSDFDALQQAV
jgi:ATP-dependent DNA ligase